MLLVAFALLSVITQATVECEQIIMTLKYARRRVRPVVVNGERVPEGTLPFVVSIKVPRQTIKDMATYMNICGGSIIGVRRVLTAAHCFALHDFYYHRHTGSVRVVAGDLRNVVTHSTNTSTATKTQWRKIDSMILHPDFHFPRNDIAVVIVKPPWSYSCFIREVALARSRIDYVGPCYSAGYGNVGHAASDRSSAMLLRAKTKVMTRHHCTSVWEINMDNFVCSYSYVSDVGVGDSGGPLVCRWTTDPAERRGQDLLVGVISGKNFDKTTLYTRVAAYSDFIGPQEHIDIPQSRGSVIGTNIIMVLKVMFSLDLLLN